MLLWGRVQGAYPNCAMADRTHRMRHQPPKQRRANRVDDGFVIRTGKNRRITDEERRKPHHRRPPSQHRAKFGAGSGPNPYFGYYPLSFSLAKMKAENLHYFPFW